MPQSSAPPQVPQSSYQQFLSSHPRRGTLRIQVSTAQGAFPVPNAVVTASRLLDGTLQIFYRGLTDPSGILEGLILPALPPAYAQNAATAEDSGTEYQISVYHPIFLPVDARPATIFADIETILPVNLTPLRQP